jgi:hypothetical protein
MRNNLHLNYTICLYYGYLHMTDNYAQYIKQKKKFSKFYFNIGYFHDIIFNALQFYLFYPVARTESNACVIITNCATVTSWLDIYKTIGHCCVADIHF